MAFVSFAQNYEDVMLWRALKEVARGTYVDVGAHDPDHDTVTRTFYDKGWSGINIEPVAKYHELLCRLRPRDVNLRLAVGAAPAEREFFEIPDTGLSTLDPQVAARHRAAGWTVVQRRVQQRPLREIWAELVRGEVHFLKIDVEGAETEVLSGAALREHRPWIIVVEAVAPLTQTAQFEEWEPLLTDAGYAFVYFDGVNRFYLASERLELKSRFEAPPNFFDDFVRASEFQAKQELAELRQKSAPLGQGGEVASRLGRIEASLANVASTLQAFAQRSHQAEQDIRFSQVAYLGEHRAVTYLRSGHKVFVDTRSVDIGTHLLLEGLWEPDYATAFCNLLRPGNIVLDIGSNHGVYALLAAQRIAPQGHVYAFEAGKGFCDLIKASVSVNGLDRVITVENLAVADASYDTTLRFDQHWSGAGRIGAGSSAATAAAGAADTQAETVHCVALDEYFARDRPEIHAIKMDIEGAEGLALKGMAATIDRSPVVKIMMEFCPAMLSRFECDAAFVLKFFQPRGFMCWTIRADGSLAPARWERLLDEPDTIRNIMLSRQGLL